MSLVQYGRICAAGRSSDATNPARSPFMANQTKDSPVTDAVETAAERVAELNEKAVANGKKAGAAYLTSYEKAVQSFAASYEKAAGATKVEWLADVASAQADFTREVTKTYAGAARELVA